MSRGPLPRPTPGRSQAGARPYRRMSDMPADEFGAPKMPAWLSPDAKKFWRRNAPTLERLGLLTALDCIGFSMLAESWADLQRIERAIREEGELLVGPRGGHRPHPLLPTQGKLRRAVVEGMQFYGMTPAA